ncbi:MAG: ROK family protein [Candidatus Gastranaerophilales bacterium]
MKKALAIDIGGTKIFNTIVDENGEILSEIDKNQTPKTYDEMVKLLNEIVEKYENDVDVIAFATAGTVDKANSKVLGSTANLFKEYPTIDFKLLSKKTVYVENDANSASWAEHKIGSSKGFDYSVMLTLGTGVGGGIILDNKLMRGKSGGAGEMHFKMRSDKHRRCTCGAYDCFEAYASGNGLKNTAVEILNDANVTSYDVINKMKSGDEKMIEIFNKWQNDLINGIIGLANLLDPDIFVLSGSMAEFVDFKYVESEVNKQIVTMPTRVVLASAGNYSGMIGVALLALESLGNG